jgi:hypothetical protein
MRRRALLTAMFVLILVPARGQADEIARTAPVMASLFDGPVTANKPEGTTPKSASLGQLNDLTSKLRALQQQFREDARLQRGAVAVGLGTAILGAARGKRSLMDVSTQALRLGLSRPLAHIRERSGFDVQAAVGYRTIRVTATRRFR